MLKNRTIAQKLGSVVFAGLMVLTAGVAVASTSASATDCNSWRNQDVNNNAPDFFRAGAACTEINGDHEVRAQLIRDAMPDAFSSYFTTEHKSYYTGWNGCPAGCTDGYQVRDR